MFFTIFLLVVSRFFALLALSRCRATVLSRETNSTLTVVSASSKLDKAYPILTWLQRIFLWISRECWQIFFAEEARKEKVVVFEDRGFLGVGLSKDPVSCPRRGESRLQKSGFPFGTLEAPMARLTLLSLRARARQWCCLPRWSDWSVT